MSKEITQYEAAGLDEKMRYVQTLTTAGGLIPSGLHDKGQPSPGKVLLVLETGAMLGIHPMAALGGIHIIEGKPSISPGLMSGLVRKAGHKLRVTTSGTIKGGDFAATATLTRADDPDFTYSATWTLDRAQRAGLAGKSVWKNYGEAMCKARSISEVVREGAEDVLMGVSYTPEEMGALVTDAGEMVQVPDEPTEDWAASIAAADSKDSVTEIVNRAKEAGEFTDAVRTLALTHYGMLKRAAEAEEVVEGEIVDEPEAEPAPAAPVEMTEAEYEAASAAEYAEAVADNA
jgi:hypothetical protein